MDRSRRRVLQQGLRWGVGAASWAALGCAGPVRTVPNPAYQRTPLAPRPGRVVLGWTARNDVALACEHAVDRLGGTPWLRRGDSVFLKVACNSPYDHPAVTSPEAVRAMVQLLRARGAGTIYAGDQSGAEHVRLTAEGRMSSTREAMTDNGLLEAIEQSGATLHCFDDQGYEGYARAEAEFANHWDGQLWLPKILAEVDHVVNLPRLGAHATAGVTGATKIAVGWLRDDSRLHLHQHADAFFEQIAEISFFRPLRDKIRLSLSVGRGALLDIGPDLGSALDLDGVLAVGSTGLLEHDALSTALVLWLDEHNSSLFDLYTPFPEDADFLNRNYVAQVWGHEGVRDYRRMVPFELGHDLATDRCLSHLAVLRGQRPSRIIVDADGDRLTDELRAYLRDYAGGLFAL